MGFDYQRSLRRRRRVDPDACCVPLWLPWTYTHHYSGND